jgi:N-methylhydantoinase A/oxoprolinase/acetone carboxylase beta subunit
VTDAAVVTGILRDQTVLGTNRPLDLSLATGALAVIGAALGIDPVAAAVAVRGVASAEIAAAVQRLLFYRGVDPRTLTLMAFGGTGPLHAADVAEIVGMSTVLVPRAAGVFTTVGLLSSEIGREKSVPVRILLEGLEGDAVEKAFADLEHDARQLFQDEASNVSPVRVERSAEMRFRQQLQTLPLNLPTGHVTDADVFERFCREYERQFRLPPGNVAEVVELRVRVTTRKIDEPVATGAPLRWALRGGETRPAVLGLDGSQPTRRFDLLHHDNSFVPTEHVAGPALVVLPHTTAVVPAGWGARLNAQGDLMVVRTAT